MNLVRKLVYAKKETDLNADYQRFTSNTTVKRYPNFMTHIEGYWNVEMSGQCVLEVAKP